MCIRDSLCGIIACVFYCQYTDLRAAAAGFQLGVQFGDGLHSAAAQHTGTCLLYTSFSDKALSVTAVSCHLSREGEVFAEEL